MSVACVVGLIFDYELYDVCGVATGMPKLAGTNVLDLKGQVIRHVSGSLFK